MHEAKTRSLGISFNKTYIYKEKRNLIKAKETR